VCALSSPYPWAGGCGWLIDGSGNRVVEYAYQYDRDDAMLFDIKKRIRKLYFIGPKIKEKRGYN
jgi:hypothetical protein